MLDDGQILGLILGLLLLLLLVVSIIGMESHACVQQHADDNLAIRWAARFLKRRRPDAGQGPPSAETARRLAASSALRQRK